MLALLLSVLAACDDAALAGAAYRDALEALRTGRYEDAVARLQEAVRCEPRETEKLQYRDRDGRHKEPYFPHYVWAQARTLQARAEPNPARQRRLYREAVTHLELTEHPSAAQALASVSADLAAVEKLASTPATEDAGLAALRRRIDDLCDQEQFLEAAQLMKVHQALLDRFPADRDALAEVLKNRRRAVLDRYEKSLIQALEVIAVNAPLDKPESLPILLRGSKLPPGIADPPDSRFEWARDFLAALDRELPALRGAAQAPADEILRCASAFDQAALRALEAGLPAGFRASANIAAALRRSRIEALAGGGDDASLERVLADAEESEDRTFRKAGREGTADPHAARRHEVRGLLEARTKARETVAAWSARAELALRDAASMAEPDALRAVAREFPPLEESAAWPGLAPALRARALRARGLLDAVASLLEGEATPEAAAHRVRAARQLDPAGFEPWAGGLPPRLKTWIGRLDR